MLGASGAPDLSSKSMEKKEILVDENLSGPIQNP